MFIQPLGGSSYTVYMTIKVKKINVDKLRSKILFVKKRLYL